MKFYIYLLLITVVLLAGCSSNESVSGLDVRDDILQDVTKVYSNLDAAMTDTVNASSYDTFGALSTERFEEEIGFIMERDYYSGYVLNKEDYSKDEYDLIDTTSDVTMLYLQYCKALITGDQQQLSQTMQRFDQKMKDLNLIINR
ncbi:hypothetical protein [Alkalihalophilus marmarensis]|uniref:hypothetical protein n=1 Tax=Alkalihalophilus marmarensis TaxID=521377 RepID=UPI002E21F363|nr:hypothetical protein [Alkalihalophilus marmarensis]